MIPGANHAQLIFQVLDNEGKPVMKDGKPVQWGVETGSAAAMARQGVSPDTFPEGTIFAVRLYPLRDGWNFGALAGMLIKCRMTMPKGGCTKETGQVILTGNARPTEICGRPFSAVRRGSRIFQRAMSLKMSLAANVF